MALTDDAQLAELGATIREQIRLISGISRPPVGSLAAEDDAYLRPFGALLQDLVHFRLRSAWDHLQAVQVLLSHSSTTTAPFAPYTVSRAGLVAAAIAHWLVIGDAEQRRWNALMIHARDVRRDKWFLEVNRDDMRPRLRGYELTQFDEAIEERDKMLRSVETRLAHSVSGQGNRFEEKDVVAQAQSVFLGETYPSPRLEVMYMRLSGVAHGLPWASQRNRRKVANLPGGFERYVHQGDRAEIINCATATMRIATAAWGRYTYLCETSASVGDSGN